MQVSFDANRSLSAWLLLRPSVQLLMLFAVFWYFSSSLPRKWCFPCIYTVWSLNFSFYFFAYSANCNTRAVLLFPYFLHWPWWLALASLFQHSIVYVCSYEVHITKSAQEANISLISMTLTWVRSMSAKLPAGKDAIQPLYANVMNEYKLTNSTRLTVKTFVSSSR